MTDLELRRVLRAMHAAAGRDWIADGPHHRKIRALWLSAWNLGVTASRSEAALATFVKRQTGMDAAVWAHDPALSAKVVEGLKAWLARPVDKGGAGVDWSACAGPDGPTDNPRLRVLEAQRRILHQMAPRVVIDDIGDRIECVVGDDLTDRMVDDLILNIGEDFPGIAEESIRHFGERIRAAAAGDAA